MLGGLQKEILYLSVKVIFLLSYFFILFMREKLEITFNYQPKSLVAKNS